MARTPIAVARVFFFWQRSCSGWRPRPVSQPKKQSGKLRTCTQSADGTRATPSVSMASLTRRSAASPCPAARRAPVPARRAKKASRRSLFLVLKRLFCVRKALREETEARRASTPPAKSPAAHTAALRVPRASSFSPASAKHRLARAWRPAAVQCAAMSASRAASFKKAFGAPLVAATGARLRLRLARFFLFRARNAPFLVSWFSDDSRWDATARLAGRRAASVSMLSAALRTRPLANARDARSGTRAATRGLFFPDATTERRFSFSISVSLRRRERNRHSRDGRAGEVLGRIGRARVFRSLSLVTGVRDPEDPGANQRVHVVPRREVAGGEPAEVSSFSVARTRSPPEAAARSVSASKASETAAAVTTSSPARGSSASMSSRTEDVDVRLMDRSLPPRRAPQRAGSIRTDAVRIRTRERPSRRRRRDASRRLAMARTRAWFPFCLSA